MAEIPEDVVTQDDLIQWYNLSEELDRIKKSELLLRQRIFRGMFKTPKEGVNDHPLADGAVLKGTYVINRKVDDAALTTLAPVFREKGNFDPDTVVKRTPEVIIGAYRKLSDEQRLMFDQCLIIKPGTPQLEITIPKR